MISGPMPVMKQPCATCPFREGGWEHLQRLLIERATGLEDGGGGTPICHSTGPDALVPKIAEPHICAGARAVQLRWFAMIGFIAAPTEEAWQAKCDEMGIGNIAAR